MGDRSGIEWTDATWNPVTGCSKVSPGCAHCYAATLAPRLHRMGQAGYTDLPWTPEHAAENVVLHPERLDMPLRWTRPRRIFVNSMSDLFHELVPDEFIARVWMRMEAAQHHTFQILTKRPDRMLEVAGRLNAHPLPNVWLGTSVENQRWADERIPLLTETPAVVRFLSCEPLLGPVDLVGPIQRWMAGRTGAVVAGGDGVTITYHGRRPIHWVIVGGESGPGHRPMDPEWVRGLRDQCAMGGVPFFLKQWGGARSGGDAVLDCVEHRAFPEVDRG